ncbi:hypothetical protein N7481_010046 [Penicillium waksmanii]|uniref:uncharacterized protein n=1 Tax=Penicillium waksmanii TaxID=69791 RepID=UPI0025484FC1|nr:uncharacterized protein N7481_010046 [Penicillium waksmanii]KAJ5976339.1 hypothetical protein N7481_010046 [Penicillium waksmanii]
MTDDMISPPSSASIDKQTPDFSISEHSYPSQMTPLASFFSLEATDAWRNQGSPPPPLWDPRLDQDWETLLTGDDFDLNAVNMSLLSATSEYIPTAEVSFDLDTTTSQPLPVDQQHSDTVQRKWHTFCKISSSGQMTPDVPNEENCIDETYRKRLADRLQQPHKSQWARKAKLFNLQPTEYHLLDTEGPSLEEAWMSWVQSEVKQRIILGLHIHDALLARIHHHEPLLRHSIDRLPQISSNELLTASNASTWKSLMLESQADSLTQSSPAQISQSRSRSPGDFALNGLLESINALTYEDQDRHSSNPNWMNTVEKSHTLLTTFHAKYNPNPNPHSQSNKPSHSPSHPSYTHTWPCTMILWHSIFITLHTDINALECAFGREGHDPKLTPMHTSYAKSWIHTLDAKRALLHAMLLQRHFETLPAGAEPAIHVPLSLYYCGIVWACFLCFGRQDGVHISMPVTLTAGDVRHFEEFGLAGVDGVGLLEQLGSILPGRLAMGSLLRVVDLLQRINHFRISQRLAETLLAVVEETQGLF